VTTGFLQGAGFALAAVIVGLVTTMVLHPTTGFLAGVAVFAWLFVRTKRRSRNPRYLEPRQPSEAEAEGR
jgi:ABC-type Fe3+-siderophore transport system permease subunit